MLLVLVRPPPDLVGGSNAGEDWQTWVEVPVPVVWANLIPNEPEHLSFFGDYIPPFFAVIDPPFGGRD